MSLPTLGDARQHFLTARHNVQLKTSLAEKVAELSTGMASDLTAHVDGNRSRLAGIERSLERVDAFAASNSRMGQMLSTMQTVLEGVDSHRQSAADALLLTTAQATTQDLDLASDAAWNALDSTIGLMNTRLGDNALFGGIDTQGNPLAEADTMIADILPSLAGLSSSTDISAAIDDWFNTPNGGFEMLGYQGDDGPPASRAISDTQSVAISARADDQAMRATLSALVKGAIADDPALNLTTAERQNLQSEAGVALVSAANNLASMQASLGYVEADVDAARVHNQAQSSSLSIARNDIVTVDPFQTATELEQIQIQLETHYTLTARLSRLSLTEYLR